MLIASTWDYAGGDGCCDFFSRYLKAANPDVPSDGHVLEIGCSEFDWLTVATQAWPEMTLVGVDWRCPPDGNERGPRAKAIKGDILQPDLFPRQRFDLIVSVSAIEHVGLGHYEHDPLDEYGDTHAIANAFRWLKVGGWLLFDVPYNPQGYRVQGSEHREYNDDELFMRLWCEPLAQAKATARWHGTSYTHARDCRTLVEKPSEPAEPFWYVGLAIQRVG